MDDEGVEWPLAKTIRDGQQSAVNKDDSIKRVSVKTTVMEKNFAYPTDARLWAWARGQLADLATEVGLDLRQSCA